MGGMVMGRFLRARNAVSLSATPLLSLSLGSLGSDIGPKDPCPITWSRVSKRRSKGWHLLS